MGFNSFTNLCGVSPSHIKGLFALFQKEGLPEPNFENKLGSGSFGDVWGCHDNRTAFKFTNQPYEATAMEYIHQNPMPGFVEVKRVVKLSMHKYVLWREMVELADNDFYSLMRTRGMVYTNFLDNFNKICRYGESKKIPADWFDAPYIKDFLKSYCELVTKNVKFMDMHMGNFGYSLEKEKVLAFDWNAYHHPKGIKVPTLTSLK
jgi:hypothetical protein